MKKLINLKTFTLGFTWALNTPMALSQTSESLSREALASRIGTLKSTSPTVVDNIKEMSQLSKRRKQGSFDSCLSNGRTLNNFQDTIEVAIRASLPSLKIASNPYIDKAYGLNPAQSVSVGLLSHPICEQDRSQIEHILSSARVPDDNTIEQLKLFAQSSNADRSKAIAGDDAALQRFVSRWTLFMGCLAYAESLQTADETKAFDAFKELVSNKKDLKSFYGGSQSRAATKPEGVHFGVDRVGQYFIDLRKAKAAGRATTSFINELNKKYPSWAVAGLYQFDPTRSGGNIGPCIDQWNELVSKNECKIDKASSYKTFTAFASYGQAVNAFCGVQKIVHAFNSQVNTSNQSGTDLENQVNGSLKKPADRCVGMVARGGEGKIYSHFGPLGNSVGDNLKSLMSCVNQATKNLN